MPQPAQYTTILHPKSVLGIGVVALLLCVSTSEAVDTRFVRFGGASDMVYVPAGEFVMGSNSRATDQRPEHVVFLDAYYIDRFEVTNARYLECVEAQVCREPKAHPNTDGPQQPVVGISWSDSETYCRWVGKRLPTEAEWEKAARGTDGRAYPWGEALECSAANYGNNVTQKGGVHECPDNPGRAADIGSYPRDVSPYGAYDMAGNVWEYVADYYQPSWYASSPYRNPSGPSSGSTHVIKGGSWYTSGRNVALSARIGRTPSPHANTYDGFRCAQDR